MVKKCVIEHPTIYVCVSSERYLFPVVTEEELRQFFPSKRQRANNQEENSNNIKRCRPAQADNEEEATLTRYLKEASEKDLALNEKQP